LKNNNGNFVERIKTMLSLKDIEEAVSNLKEKELRKFRA